MVIQTGKDEFLMAGGIGEIVIGVSGNESFKKGKQVGFLSVDEIYFDEDGNEHLHRLNGDETAFGDAVIPRGKIKAFRIKLYQYE